jgi:predicted DNA-binding protein with PD1-like motif
MGRVFVLRLEDGEVLNDTVEAFAKDQGLERALAFYVGGVADGSKVVVGPDQSTRCTSGISALVHTLGGSQEAFAVGTLFPNEAGIPVLHMHTASGREGQATVGCTRAGVHTWLVGEVVLVELVGSEAVRIFDTHSGFALLDV